MEGFQVKLRDRASCLLRVARRATRFCLAAARRDTLTGDTWLSRERERCRWRDSAARGDLSFVIRDSTRPGRVARATVPRGSATTVPRRALIPRDDRAYPEIYICDETLYTLGDAGTTRHSGYRAKSPRYWGDGGFVIGFGWVSKLVGLLQVVSDYVS